MMGFRLTARPGALRAPGAVPPVFGLSCIALAAFHVVYFPVAYQTGSWIYEASGLGIPTDFVNVWSAGKLSLQGTPALAYEWDVQKALQMAELGQTWPGYYAWHYPPPFLFIATALATLPYGVAYAAWPLVSLIPYLLAMRAIVGKPLGWALALAFPVVLANVMIGQNGFLTASLIGGCLFLLPMRPILAGICLGLLSYKPQYGLLFPLILLVTMQWRALAAAMATVLTMVAASILAFGWETWPAFAHWLPIASKTFLTDGGQLIWGKMQSVYAATRYLGGSDRLGWALQMACGALTAAALVVLWRGRAPYAIKAAGLATGVLLVTPYIFLYDMMVLAIAVGFLLRAGIATGFRRHEMPLLSTAGLILLAFPLAMAPIGLAATLILAALVGARAGWFEALRGWLSRGHAPLPQASRP